MASSSDDVVLETSLVLGVIMRRRNRRRRFGRQEWVRPILQKRYQQGDYHNLLQEMRLVILTAITSISHVKGDI